MCEIGSERKQNRKGNTRQEVADSGSRKRYTREKSDGTYRLLKAYNAENNDAEKAEKKEKSPIGQEKSEMLGSVSNVAPSRCPIKCHPFQGW